MEEKRPVISAPGGFLTKNRLFFLRGNKMACCFRDGFILIKK
jgi:hypothetical protein